MAPVPTLNRWIRPTDAGTVKLANFAGLKNDGDLLRGSNIESRRQLGLAQELKDLDEVGRRCSQGETPAHDAKANHAPLDAATERRIRTG